MPCTQTGSPYGDLQLEYHELAKRSRNTNAWLCEVMGKLEEFNYTNVIITKLSPELLAWWEEHKLQDIEQRKREEKEALTHKGALMEEVP